MSKNKKIGFIVGGVVVLIVVFYVGTVVGKGQTSNKNGSDLQAFGQNGGNFSGPFEKGTKTGGMGGNGTSGEIISKDAQSITVSLPNNGGSKIILISNNTPVTKQASGSIADLAVGTTITATGTTNQDGSISAQSIQIRPKTAGLMQPATTTPNPAQ